MCLTCAGSVLLRSYTGFGYYYFGHPSVWFTWSFVEFIWFIPFFLEGWLSSRRKHWCRTWWIIECECWGALAADWSVRWGWPRGYLRGPDAGHVGGSSVTFSHEPQRSRRIGEGSLCVDRRALIDGASGSSSTPPRRCGGGSVKNKAARNLADASRAILPRMRCSFVDWQYSSSTCMDQSEWEIILEELICMRFLVKQKPLSEGEDQ
jgi:hypothetical protein